MRKILTAIIIFIILIQPIKIYGVVSLWADYDAEAFAILARELESKYPDIIKVTTIGHSTDHREITAIILTANVLDMEENDDFYTDKLHYLIEGGLHSRENVSTPMLLKIIESYAVDYYMPEYLMDVEMKDLLDQVVFHFIPLSNPDGYDLANVGLNSISEPYKSYLQTMPSDNYSNYKSNVNGVDLNRNFPGLYYDLSEGMFKDIWNKKHKYYRSFVPGSAFYFGETSGSEVETQVLMDYLLKYDFRNYLSFHSRGEVLYWKRAMLDVGFNHRSEALAGQIADYTGYDKDQDAYQASSGYMMDFTAMQTLKPSITIETVHHRYTLPTTKENITKAYMENLLVPVIAAREGIRTGYFDYKLYIDHVYVRDYPTEAYGQAWAKETGGVLHTYKGQPIRELSDDHQALSRKDVVHLIMKDIHVDEKVTLESFDDTDDVKLLQARHLGIINGFNNKFNPDGMATHQGTYVMLYNTFFTNQLSTNNYDYKIYWASDAVNVLLENHIISEDEIRVGPILKDELLMFLDRVAKADILLSRTK